MEVAKQAAADKMQEQYGISEINESKGLINDREEYTFLPPEKTDNAFIKKVGPEVIREQIESDFKDLLPEGVEPARLKVEGDLQTANEVNQNKDRSWKVYFTDKNGNKQYIVNDKKEALRYRINKRAVEAVKPGIIDRVTTAVKEQTNKSLDFLKQKKDETEGIISGSTGKEQIGELINDPIVQETIKATNITPESKPEEVKQEVVKTLKAVADSRPELSTMEVVKAVGKQMAKTIANSTAIGIIGSVINEFSKATEDGKKEDKGIIEKVWDSLF